MASIWRENMLGYLFGDVIDCCMKRAVFLELEENCELCSWKIIRVITKTKRRLLCSVYGSFEYWGMSDSFHLAGYILSRE